MDNYKFPTVEELLEAGVHLGHSVNKWNPKMAPYIYSAKQGVHIIDLDKTQAMLENAGRYLFDVASKGGQIIFVCTKKQVAQIAKDQAIKCGAMYMSERWMGGTITNFKVIKRSIDTLVGLKKKRESGELSMYTKKERLLIDRDIAKLEKFFGGVVPLTGEPQAVFVIDAKREHTAANECRIFNVPVVALIDTNSDPTGILKLIPGNDDAAKSVGKVLSVIADCIAAGYKEYEKTKKNLTSVEEAKKVPTVSGGGVKPDVGEVKPESEGMKIKSSDTAEEVKSEIIEGVQDKKKLVVKGKSKVVKSGGGKTAVKRGKKVGTESTKPIKRVVKKTEKTEKSKKPTKKVKKEVK